MLASDIDPDRRRAIADRAAREHASNVRVVEAVRDSTNLADRCCQAIYMRTMFHHVADTTAYALDVVRSLLLGVTGSGLGLAIVEDCVKAMGGSIRCESTLGEGSAFFIELPRRDEARPSDRS